MKLVIILLSILSLSVQADVPRLSLLDYVEKDDDSKKENNEQKTEAEIKLEDLPEKERLRLLQDRRLTRNLTKLSQIKLSGTEAAAGGFSSGGGGNAVVCSDINGLITEIQLLDFVEGLRKDTREDPIIDLSGKSVPDNIKKAFERMKQRWPFLGEKLLKRALEVERNIESYFISAQEGALTPIYDMNLTYVPTQNKQGDECAIARFAVQHRDNLAGQKKFSFVEELYNHSTTDNAARAGIIIHEVIYEEAIKEGAVNSDFVRWLTYLLSSSSFEKLDDSDFEEIEIDQRAEFLKGHSFEYFQSNKPYSDSTAELRVFTAGESVLYLQDYEIAGSNCFDIGICEVQEGTIEKEAKSTTDLFPKYDVKNNRSEEVLPFMVSDIAKTVQGVCHPDGGCVGARVYVSNFSMMSRVRYEGVIVGVFSEGDFAIKVTKPTFRLTGIHLDIADDVILYAEKSTVNF